MIKTFEEIMKYKAYNFVPVCKEIYADAITPINMLRKLSLKSDNYYLLESVEGGEKWARYSFLGFNPIFRIYGKENKAYKVLFEDSFNPNIVRWKDENNLLILTNGDGFSKIYNHDIRDAKTELVAIINKNIFDFRVKGKSYILVENHDTDKNKNIYITYDWNQLNYIGKGLNVRFLNDKMIVYLKENENDTSNILNIYNLEEMKVYDKVDLDVLSISTVTENGFLLIEKNQGANNFNIHQYNLEDKESTFITMVNNENILYDSNKNLIYVNLVVPYEAEKSEIIFSLDLEKLINTIP